MGKWGEPLHHLARRQRHLAIVLAMLGGWWTAAWPAATVSVHPVGRYEILLQEGVPIGIGEILGVVRRPIGRPEYPLMFGADRHRIELNVLGPGHRPLRLASTEVRWPAASGAGPAKFIVERAAIQGDVLVLRVRHASRPGPVSLSVNLPRLERTLEGER